MLDDFVKWLLKIVGFPSQFNTHPQLSIRANAQASKKADPTCVRPVPAPGNFYMIANDQRLLYGVLTPLTGATDNTCYVECR
jgi:hypothetical protein